MRITKPKFVSTHVEKVLFIVVIISGFAAFITYLNPKIFTRPDNENGNTSELLVEAKSQVNAKIDRSSTPATTPIPQVEIAQTTGRDLKIGFVIPNYTNSSSLRETENMISKKISTISIFKQFGLEGNKYLNPELISHLKEAGIKLQIAWEPWNPNEGNSQSQDYLTRIKNGELDGYIREFAAEIKSYGGPVVLRFAHEMNGSWYPWGQRDADYKGAYRRIWEVFKNEEVTNVNFMWSVNITSNPNELSDYYPGNELVDVIGIDGFNFGTSQNYGGWKEFSELFGPTYHYLSSNYSKPIVISETASSESGGDKAAWINNMYRSLNSEFNAIQEVIWFNLNKEADWRVNSSETSLNAFSK